MIDMSSWEQLTADVMDELHLDPHNVRLDGVAHAPEADIMADLFRNEKALALVEGIVKVGYLTHEIPIVVRRDHRLVVAEGNRRLAALKAIQNPYLVPDFQTRVSVLTAGMPNRDLLRRIDVKLAPSQSDADQLIAALHTGNARVPWTPARQAAFFQAQVDQGKTLSQLKTQYPTVEVERFMLRSRIMSLFKSVHYSDPRLSDLLARRNFPTSVLARIYESSDFIKLTGIRLDSDGELRIDVSPEVFGHMAENIVSGIAEGDINTRSVGRVDSPRFLALMAELRDLLAAAAPMPTQTDVGTSATASPSTSGTSDLRDPPDDESSSTDNGADGAADDDTRSNGIAAGTTGTKHSKPRPFLDTSQLSVPASYPPAIGKALQELSAINIQRFPNATFDLMRSFLEKSIKAYADSVHEDIRKTDTQQGYVYLKQCIEWLERRVALIGPKYLNQVIRKLQSNKIDYYVMSMDHLNAINHNHHIFVTPDEVRQSWDLLLSVFAIILTSSPEQADE